MKNNLRQVFRSPKFVFGFSIIVFLLIFVLVYPLFNPGDPLAMIGRNSFIKPGLYVSTYDSLNTMDTYTFILPDAAGNRIANRLSPDDRVRMREYLLLFGLPEDVIDADDVEGILRLWWDNYDESLRLGARAADRQFYARLDGRIRGLLTSYDMQISNWDPYLNEYTEGGNVRATDYVNVGDVANTIFLPLGTDNFGSDMLKKLAAAITVSLQIGLIAGTIATSIGLVLGLLSGYIGGIVDDLIMFIVNLFTVVPGFVLLILISYSISQAQRGATTVAVVIGLTSWVWTTRSVRSQVLSLRNRDHVNLSKLSGHSLPRILVKDILPYIASYVVMALILQISTAILAEAQLSMLGLGPKTTEVPTLGLMMNWAMIYTAHLNGSWWAYYPVILVIALISFSLNLMNTGLDQVFNPQLRD
ncbi:MAG: ABC transporter permease [Defluviitaleaceae bacterium]|nr:ABC transporter permease [Defluviitaleaceae bacterium]MCL2836604.1 ABC transporter permease [Defluviitaleaceae bacterium]